MTEQTVTERRTSNNQLIENMLVERKQLLSLLFQLPGVGAEESSESDKELFEDFCQVLVDYIAAGHFGLYARIAEGQERRKAVADLAAQFYPRIEQSTEIALAFNEKYDSKSAKYPLPELQKDISKLGEEMTTRIELEDQLIESIIR